MITKLVGNNFTAFKEIEVNFSPKINVIIGENSTGKTHLLKLIFSLLRIILVKNIDKEFPPRNQFEVFFADNFDPQDNQIDFLHDASVPNSKVILQLRGNDSVSAILSDKPENFEFLNQCNNLYFPACFIPSKEIMFLIPDLVNFVNNYELRVDKIFHLMMTGLIHPKLKSEQLTIESASILEKISELLGGRFFVDKNLTLKFDENGVIRSANMMAEGFRKIGVLSRLIESGNLVPGKSGPLLWDEPENNLNPKLIKSLVEILIEMSKSGQQIILVTHNFMLMNWFEILTEHEEKNIVTYHSLYRNSDTNEINISTSNQYNDIVSNTMEDAFASFVDYDITATMERLNGKNR